MDGRLIRLSISAFSWVSVALAVPRGFPASGNALWYSTPGNVWSKSWLPIGNGYLGAMLPGGTSQEATQLNIESLWSGGPFQDPSYNGGNKQLNETAAMAREMQTIKQTIFTNSTGEIDNITVLNTDAGAYGSYSAAGYFLSTLNVSGTVSEYARWLNLDDGIHYTTWMQNNVSFSRETLCSHPTQACSQQLTSSADVLPPLTVAWSNYTSPDLLLPQITCVDSRTFRIRGKPSDPGMDYELLLRATASGGSVSCASVPVLSTSTPLTGQTPANATISIRGARSVTLTWVGGTSYDMSAGDAAHNFSFKGTDPHATLVKLLSSATGQSYNIARSAHVKDFTSVLGSFSLDLGQDRVPSATTDVLLADYQVDTGNPYLEWLTFNYGRYMLASSARGVLPANLQGKWANGAGAPWSGDYHANINIQMNYWAAELTGLNLVGPLFDYMEKTWVPRGEYTARVLYNITRGWVTHNEMNIFGHTGMKSYGNSAQWANYPEANVWMMFHVYDHLSFTNDVSWWREQGWPLLKSVTQFHLDKLVPDEFHKDGTLVTVPCNSPEQVPITLGCTHAQTMIWQLFNAAEKGFALSGDPDTVFLDEVRVKRSKMDKGIHIGSWGQLQEWKIEKDSPSDTHRHLSHLIGLYPGYAITNYVSSLQSPNNTEKYTLAQVLNAARTSLTHRGNGTGPDADAGWEKVWRAAAWAQFGDANKFYHILTYALQRDFGPNLFSLYNPFADDPIFQIDANLGYPAALLNALIQTPDTATIDVPLHIIILPALPAAWSTGSLKGARVRGGITVDLSWKSGKPTLATLSVGKSVPGTSDRKVQVVYAGQVVAEVVTGSGTVKKVTFDRYGDP